MGKWVWFKVTEWPDSHKQILRKLRTIKLFVSNLVQWVCESSNKVRNLSDEKEPMFVLAECFSCRQQFFNIETIHEHFPGCTSDVLIGYWLVVCVRLIVRWFCQLDFCIETQSFRKSLFVRVRIPSGKKTRSCQPWRGLLNLKDMPMVL